MKIQKISDFFHNKRRSAAMPNSMKYFERIWVASLIIGAIIVFFDYKITYKSGYKIDVVLNYGLILAIAFLLVILTSRKRSNIAKWILLILFGIRVVLYARQLPGYFDMSFSTTFSSPRFEAEMAAIVSRRQLSMLFWSFQILIQCAGVYFLFVKESRDWWRDANSRESASLK